MAEECISSEYVLTVVGAGVKVVYLLEYGFLPLQMVGKIIKCVRDNNQRSAHSMVKVSHCLGYIIFYISSKRLTLFQNSLVHVKRSIN